jgi:Fe-only nitrogenase accessory protein AnfO
MEIAVLVCKTENEPSFYGEGSIHIISDESGAWTKIRDVSYTPFGNGVDIALPEIHRRIRELVSNLGDCRIFVSPQIRGIPFAILDSDGFSIWQLEGEAELLYNHIRKTVKERSENKNCSDRCSCGGSSDKKIIPVPEAMLLDGEYSINLKKILDDNDSLNSMEILIPFIQAASFTKLTIICDHTPRWLEKDYELFNLLLEEEYTLEKLCVTTLKPDPSKKDKLNIPYPMGGCGGRRQSSCFEG